jgi:hypothetical protein
MPPEYEYNLGDEKRHALAYLISKNMSTEPSVLPVTAHLERVTLGSSPPLRRSTEAWRCIKDRAIVQDVLAKQRITIAYMLGIAS